MLSSDGTDYGSWTADNIKRAIASFHESWKGPQLLFGCIALTMMVTYKYNVTGKGILEYRFDEARKEREARERREKARKNNIDISLC